MDNNAQIYQIQDGYAIWNEDHTNQRADGSITLIKSQWKVIVDTGLPKDKDIILKGIEEQGLTGNDIDFIVCTHGDADHTSNNNLFPHAKLIVGFDIYEGDIASFFSHELQIDTNITIMGMTGHDDRSIGVIVRTVKGIIAITGDLFEYEKDYMDIANWIAFSKNPEEQIQNRAKVWEIADYIIPGHGPMYKVDKLIHLKEVEEKALKHILTLNNVYGDTTTAEEFD